MVLVDPSLPPIPAPECLRSAPEVGVRPGSQVVAFSWLIGLSRIGRLQGQMGFPEDLEAQDSPAQITAEGRHSLPTVPPFSLLSETQSPCVKPAKFSPTHTFPRPQHFLRTGLGSFQRSREEWPWG